MNSGNRGVFLGILALVAVIGVVVIFLATRPRTTVATATPSTTNAPEVTLTINGQSVTIKGKPITGSATDGARFTFGEPNANFTVVEWGNYLCSHCRAFNADTKAQFMSEFVDTGKVYFVYRDMTNGQPASERSAEAAACAADQNSFETYHDALFRQVEEWGVLTDAALDSRLIGYADLIGLNTETFRNCLTGGTKLAAILADREAAIKAGVTGTPAFAIGGYLFEGELPIEALRTIMDQISKKARTQ